MSTTLFTHIDQLLTLSPAAQKQGRHIQEIDLGCLRDGAIAVKKGQIVWVGVRKEIPREIRKHITKSVELNAASVLPGFIECHTHLIHGGDRAAEFEMRNQGVSYQEIAKRGGGILSTMRETRQARKNDLFDSAVRRVDHFVAQGVTIVESKSGYALNLKDELKMLEVGRLLDQRTRSARVINTFLGAHALPPEFKTYEDYLNFLAEEVLPVIARKKLAERVDIFIENGFFPKAAGQVYLEKARKLGFEVVVHADQLQLSGGHEVAIELSALSADHLVQLDAAGIYKIAKSEVTAVLLPAADLYMKMAYPPARSLIDQGARVALATDFNPGSSPTQDLNLVGLLARLHMKMSLPEVIAAYTVGASYALNMQNSVGSLCVGKNADFVCSDLDWRQLFYNVGERSIRSVYRDGHRIYNKK